jgi:hypothetical protein
MAKEVVSGVGKQAKRTDLNPSRQQMRYIAGGTYGEGQATLDQQRGAPMAGKSAKVPTPKVSPGKLAQLPQMTPITAPTERPGEAPEVGMPFGDGPGPAEIGLNIASGRPESPRKQDLQKLTQYLPIIETAANQEGAPATLSTFVKYLRSL